MSKATPLEQLNDSQDDDLVNDVLNDLDNDMNDDAEYEQIERQHQDRYRQYQHDQSPVAHFQGNEEGYQNQPHGEMVQGMEHFGGLTWGQLLWEEAKSPLLFMAVFLLLNWKVLTRMLVNNLPESGMTQTYLLLLKAVLGAILFYVVRMFVLPML